MKTLKSLSIIASVAAVFATVSCTKEDAPSVNPEAAINTITLSIEQSTDESATKTQLGSATSGSYPINWTLGTAHTDAIAVGTTGGSDVVKYTLSSVDSKDATKGTFTTTGTAPEGEVKAFYPYADVVSAAENVYNVNIPAVQTYTGATSFGEDAMPMYAVATSTGDLSSMKPLMSVLKITLSGSCTVKRIIISNASEKLSGSATVTYTSESASLAFASTGANDYVELVCPTAVDLSSGSNATFHIVVPATTATSKYTVRVVTSESKVMTKKFTPTNKFTAAKIKNLTTVLAVSPGTNVQYVEGSYCGAAITVGSNIWAPVNCGYNATNAPTGLFYQWGRKYGQSNTKEMTDADFITTKAESMAAGNTEANRDKFYTGNSCWFTGSTTSDTWSSEYDPCPTGWRVPKEAELSSLSSSSTWVTGKDITGKGSGTYSGRLFPDSGDTQIFLPVAGYRDYSNGSVYYATTRGYYWSSSPNSSNAYNARRLYFSSSSASMNGNNRAYGFSVRCVQE